MKTRIFLSDGLKYKRTWILFLSILGPIGIILLTAARYIIQYKKLVTMTNDHWMILLHEVNPLFIPALLLGMTMLASLIVGIEQQSSMWKQLLSLPVARTKLYLSKFLWLVLLMGSASLLLIIGITLLGIMLGFGSSIPWKTIITGIYYPYLASFAVMAFQILLSTVLSNQAIPIIIGVLGTLMGILYTTFPKWLPWTYPALATSSSSDSIGYVVASLIMGIILTAVGCFIFSKKEVK